MSETWELGLDIGHLGKGLSVASIKIDSRLRCWFFETGKVFCYSSVRSADPFSTHKPFWIWDIDLRSGVDKFIALKEKNEVSFVFLAACSELAMNNHSHSIG